jgi:hypothetical protein
VLADISHLAFFQNLVGVRYAYTQFPTGSNLYNKIGLPASPFSTNGY